jgi:hypothetical protein
MVTMIVVTMRKNPGDGLLSSVVMWGSLWALGELTLGHGLHLIGIPGLAGYVMFPLGMAMMIRIYRDTGRRGAVLAGAALAAGLKLLDLFLPAPNPFTVLNPALAILAEGLAAAVFFLPKGIRSGGSRRFAALGKTAIAWRGIYALAVAAAGLGFSLPSVLSLGPSRLFGFFILESLGNTILLGFGFFLLDGGARFRPTGRIPIPILVFIAAAAAQVLL